MRMLVLYPMLSFRSVPVLYVRRVATNITEAGKHLVYGPGRVDYIEGETVPKIINRLGPFDRVLVLEPKYAAYWIQGLEKVTLKKGVLLTDYVTFKRQVDRTNRFLDICRFDVLFHHTLVEGKNLKAYKRKENAVYLPMGVDPEYFKRLNLPRVYDVAAMWNDNADAYPERLQIKRMLRKEPGLSVFLEQTFFEDYVRVLNQSKICISSRSIDKNIQSRFTEAAACGSLLLTDPVEDLGVQGWRDGINLVVYHNIYELIEKAKFYASHEEERSRITEKAYSFVLDNFRNELLIKKIEDVMEAL